MQVGLVGLGRMGANMSRRWLRSGHAVFGYARTKATVDGLAAEGALSGGSISLADLVVKLEAPRVLWLMVPAASVDATLDQLKPLLAAGDIVVDGGNSYYRDDIRRSAELEPTGIRYLDCGTSGGVWGLERGYCLMIGGPDDAVAHLDPLFRALAPGVAAAPRTPGREGEPDAAEQGYLHCGPAGVPVRPGVREVDSTPGASARKIGSRYSAASVPPRRRSPPASMVVFEPSISALRGGQACGL